MLFDLKGKRRRAVQGTYLLLAVLMGGGLVFFGIGSDVSGGLFDAFSENPDGGGTSSLVAERVAKADQRLRVNPRDEIALKDAIRGHYQLAADTADPNTGSFPPQARPELGRAAAAWERYLALRPKAVDSSLAGLMLQVYSEAGLNRPAGAAQAAEMVARARPSASAFLQVATYATLAGETSKADRAGRKAVDLASAKERSTVKRQVRQLERLRSATRAAQGAGQPSGGPPEQGPSPRQPTGAR